MQTEFTQKKSTKRLRGYGVGLWKKYIEFRGEADLLITEGNIVVFLKWVLDTTKVARKNSLVAISDSLRAYLRKKQGDCILESFKGVSPH